MDDVTARDILEAYRRVRPLVDRTPLEPSPALVERCGAEILLKMEQAQRTGSFKPRGALNVLHRLRGTVPGVITASAGNHALGVAYASRHLGVPAVVVVAETASAAKVAALRRWPVELVQAGRDYDAAEAHARALSRERGWPYLTPYNDPAIIAGHGTVAVEIFQDLPETDVLLVPVGAGGLISGMAVYAKTVNPRCTVIGIQAEASPALVEARRQGRVVPVAVMPTLADGLAGNIDADSMTFTLIERYVDDVLLVSESSIARAILWLLEEHRVLIEGSGAVGVAVLLERQVRPKPGSRVVAVLTGRNVAADALKRLLADTSGRA
ncbi:MAG: threonine/serine dehydratase [Armatimonadetes bacterium]|nr:threonine/serine dehydratase [Armatimonadota bacterium]